MRILVLDNYDSFTYNLVHIIRELGYGDSMDVYRNDKIALEAVGGYDKILLSPGPGIPSEAGILLDLVRTYGASKSILGICLGHQAIGEVYGAALYNMTDVLHGVGTRVQVLAKDDYLFQDVPNEFMVCRYHSWAVDASTVNGEMEIIAEDDKGIVMGLSHKTHDVRGLQFHPESILTENGIKLMQNWLEKNRD
ncbi:MAG: aminodeoxychorismate/anthranilate synthase component II [Cyclobacteriaceae bacterium]|nr:aminodeoxychorismate/anthranilate synthase component II [Cyclobacteriaceae bacterium]